MTPCKKHAPHVGAQVWQPRADGYCTDACRTFSFEARINELERAISSIVNARRAPSEWASPGIDEAILRAAQVLG